jgi:alpha,alpha-trehalase
MFLIRFEQAFCRTTLALLITLASSAQARAPSVSPLESPKQLYGPLFEVVQSARIFPDGKTFVDAVPKLSPEQILVAYQQEQPTAPQAVRAFVTRYFELPKEAPPTQTLPRQIATLRPELSRPEMIPVAYHHHPKQPMRSEPLGAPVAKTLRSHIAALWPQLTRPPTLSPTSGSSLVDLPHPYIVPGGRFREIYYWDSYFTMLGLKADGEDHLVDAMLLNFESLITRYGFIPNGTRSYYLGRSQPPFFSQMIGLSRRSDRATVARQLAMLRAEYRFWMAGAASLGTNQASARVVRMPDGSLLNRYWDDRSGPREESWAEDLEVAHATDRPKDSVYKHLRAGAESGWDYSSRWLTDPGRLTSIRTTDIVPVDLNSLLWALERDIGQLCKTVQDLTCTQDFEDKAKRRALAMSRYLWLVQEGRFADWDRRAQTTTPVLSAATLYPLYVGLANPEQARLVAATTQAKLLASGGLRTTNVSSPQQWDMPNGWAPLQWIAIEGLVRYGHDALAKRIARSWVNTVTVTFRETGKMMEKYDVEQCRPGGGGEYPLQDGFGWTNGVTRMILVRYPDLDPD